MYKQTYISDPLTYDAYPGSPSAVYNGYLTTPPRHYVESLTRMTVLTSTSQGYTMMGWLDYIYWPSWRNTTYVFGNRPSDPHLKIKAKGDVAPIWQAWTASIVAGWGGGLWRADVFGNISSLSIYVGQNSETGDWESSITQGDEIPASRFGVVAIYFPAVDLDNDLIAMKGQDLNTVAVYTLSTGALLRKIRVSGSPVALCPADTGQLYVLCSNNILNIVNVQTGQVLGTSLFPRTPGADIPVLAWDVAYRRLLAFEPTPDASDGQGTSRIRGYYPVPIATELTNPIPLKAPRSYRKTPIVCRLVGDVGEPIAAATIAGAVTPTAPATATLTVASATPDGNGYAMLELLGGTPGTVNFTVTAQA